MSYPWHRCHSVSLLPCPACPLVQFPEDPTVSAHSFRRCTVLGEGPAWPCGCGVKGAGGRCPHPLSRVQVSRRQRYPSGGTGRSQPCAGHRTTRGRGTEAQRGRRAAGRPRERGACAADGLASSPLWNGPGRGTETAQLSFSLNLHAPTANANVLRECSGRRHKDGTSAPGSRLRGEPSEEGAGCRSPRLPADGQWPSAGRPLSPPASDSRFCQVNSRCLLGAWEPGRCWDGPRATLLP